MKEELEKTIQAKTFQECVGKMISHEAHSHPEYPHDQVIAIAHEKCRARFPGHSKAELIYYLEQNPLLDKQSQEAFINTVKNTFERADWIEYALILKKEGKPIKEITDRIVYKESWLKKWVNPILKSVTAFETRLQGPEQKVIIEPDLYFPDSVKLLDFSIIDIQKKERIFEGWGSVEVRDSQGDIIPIEALERVMPINMRRGGVIMFSHTNRHVGKLLSYKFTKKKVEDKSIPALWLKGQIFNDYKVDDQAWECIQLANATGKSVLSLGGTPLRETFECKDDFCFRKVEDLQLYEWSVTNLMEGSGGANPESTIEVALEKSDLEASELLSSNFELSKDDLELVDLLLGTCSRCQDEYLSLIEKGFSDLEAKSQIYAELTKELEETEKMNPEVENKTKESETQENPDQTENPENPEQAKQGEDLAQVLQTIMSTLQRIEAKVMGGKEEPEKPPTEEEEVTEEAEAEPLKLSKEVVESLAKSKEFATLLEKAGFKKVSTPPPTETRKQDIQKGSKTQKAIYPSIEEIREAREKGKLEELSEKYGYPI